MRRRAGPVIAGITDWILGLHGWVALAIVFLLPALEASAFLGFFFPGEIAVLLGGVLAFEGRISLPSAIVAAVLGAFIGDSIGYFVGKRWGHQILRGIGKRIPFLRHRVDEHLATAQAYLKKKGGRAVLIGRFTAALRVMVPGLAGMSGMPYARFAAFNGAGAIVWGTGFVLLGYFAGAAWHTVADAAGKIGLGLAVLLLLGLMLTRIVRGTREGRSISHRLAALPPVEWFRATYPRLSAWLARRIDTGDPRGFLLSLVVVAGGLCAWLFGGLVQDVVAHEEAVNLDPGIERFVLDHRAPWLTDVLRNFTWLGSNAVLVPLIAAVVVFFLARRRNWRPAALAVAALAGADALYDIVKPIVERPRPPVPLHLVGVSGFSFPSGHATAVTAVWGMVATLLLVGTPLRRKVLAGVLVALVVLLVAISRVYLGVHWFTDVVGGIALGGLWLCVLWMVAILSGGLVDAGARRASGDRSRRRTPRRAGSNSEAAA